MNLFRRMLFSEASALIKLAKTKDLTEEDVLPLPADLNPETKISNLEDVRWTDPRSFLFSLMKVLKKYLGPGYSWYLLSNILALFSPVLVHRFVGLISAGVTKENLPWVLTYGILLGVSGFLSGIFMQYYFFLSLRAYQVATNILNEKIFSHSLKLSQNARQENQIGDIVNHMSSDSDSVSDFALVLGDFIAAVFLIFGVVFMLFYYIGWSALAALVVLFTLAPLTNYVAKKFTALDTEMMRHRDRRVTLMTQALGAIRVVKYFAWEKSVAKEVSDIREKELTSRRRLARAEVISSLAYLAVSSIVLFVALTAHAWRGKSLDAAIIFTCISLFGILEGPFGHLSQLLSRGTNAFVAAGRILNFLKQEQVNSKDEVFTEVNDSVGIEVKGLSLSYPKSQQEVIKNLDLNVKPGGSIAIVGPVGAGKSSILYALLGEFQPEHGHIEFISLKKNQRPRMAYVSQEAYIINGSLLENLQFGEDVTQDDVSLSLYNSCLHQDLKEWKGGLQTEIGEKGVNLSGGQKQRVALARAYLRKPKLVLLDDPLSAVDAETEKNLCDRLIFGAWKDVTRIVVTHRLEHLSRFDQILYIENGQVHGLGHFNELIKVCQPFAEFYKEHSKTQGENSQSAPVKDASAEKAKESVTEKVLSGSRLTEDEDREVGAVKGSVYWDYVSSLGGNGRYAKPFILTFLFAGAVGVTLLPLAQKYWLSYYSSHQNSWAALQAVGVFGVLGLASLIGSFLNNIFWLHRGIKAGKNIHDKMLTSVLYSPVRFFDSTPIGRIIQRFSRDIESVDVHLQWSFDTAIHCGLQVAVSLVLILTLMPLTIFAIIPIMGLYYILQRDYRRPAREIKRFDSVQRRRNYWSLETSFNVELCHEPRPRFTVTRNRGRLELKPRSKATSLLSTSLINQSPSYRHG